MKRREFITLLGGAVTARPFAARAQQGERVRQIAVLDGVAESDLEARTNLAAFLQELQQLGWSDGRNMRFDICPQRSLPTNLAVAYPSRWCSSVTSCGQMVVARSRA
jgi:hypothetical protein